MGNMSELRDAVSRVLNEEIARIKNQYGETYASIHEAYGVLAEELHEARNEVKVLRSHVKDLLVDLPFEDRDDLRCDLNEAYWHALNGACELIQVAAVCRKAMDGLGGGGAS
jgi:hypothetical protein